MRVRVHVRVLCINAGMLDCLASDQSGTGMKNLTMLGQVRYWTKPRQSGIFWVWYQTEIIETGIPMSALVSWMPMPSYGIMLSTCSASCIQCSVLLYVSHMICILFSIMSGRAGHNFCCPLISPLFLDPLIDRTAHILDFEKVNLTEERLFLNLLCH